MKAVISENAFIPKKAHTEDAGFDLFTPYSFKLYGGQTAIVDTGVRFQIPEGYCGIISCKSGLACNDNVESTNGIIDCGYTGTIRVKLTNNSGHTKFFERGDKISQMIIVAIHPDSDIEIVESLQDTDRGESGFGSTGR